MIKTTSNKLNLHLIDVWKEDIKNEYIKVYDMPETIGLGKHSFLLDVGADRLVTDTQLKIELIDSNNNVIYTNVPKYREGTLRRVSIHVYNTATDGAATLTILGVAKDAPPEWNDTYNIKYTTTININKPLENTSPIRFYKDPISNITEIRTPYVNRYLASGSTSLISGSVEGTWNDKFNTYELKFDDSVLTYNMINADFTASDLNYTTKLSKIVKPTIAYAEYPYYGITENNKITNFKYTPYTMSYENIPEYKTSDNYKSYANIELSNLELFSGQLSRIKTYAKSRGSAGKSDYELINDTVLDSKEMLIDSSSITQYERTGYFYNQNTIDTWWNTNNVNAVYNSSVLLDSAYITAAENGTLVYNTNIEFYEDEEYNVSLNIIGTTDTPGQSVDIYISGSAFGTDEIGYGKLIKTITLKDSININTVSVPFTADNTGYGKLKFKFTLGNWYISDVSLKSNNPKGFSPNRYNLLIPINRWQRNDVIDFKFEYYNSNNYKAPQITYDYNKLFDGSNVYIDGNDNLLSGSLFVGNELDAHGFELAGKHSAYLRTRNYIGFNSASAGANSGILMWSGSVLTDLTDEYQQGGIGLELVADSESYLRYRTNPSELDIRTNNIFIGNPDIAYISASGGYLEISSSNFLLSSSGDVFVSGTINADSGSIGGWEITPNSLQRETNNYFVGMSTAGDYRFYAGSTSDTAEDQAGANFSVNYKGYLSASLGKIGGWNIDSTKISSSNIILNSNGSIGTADYISSRQGWNIDSLGYAEFNDAFIRGTLATTVFRKNTINAVGGQLWVANSTTLSGSSVSEGVPYTVGPTDTEFKIADDTGFVVGEILIIKKDTETGFNTEYVLVESTDTNEITVERGYGETEPETYSQGQVIVSTGKVGTGYIVANANPVDGHTPYIDIVERTGSNIGDTDVIVRLGDLSGISNIVEQYGLDSSYGLYTQNGYFQGAIVAETGSFSGKVHVGNLILGTNVLNTLDGIFFNDGENYWVTNDNNEVSFSLGGPNGITYNSGSNILIGSDVDISGSISAISGSIGGWDIYDNRLQSVDNNMILSASGVISSSNFYVNETGVISASSAYFSGSVFIGGELTGSVIYPGGGNISGWEITDNWLVDSNNKIKLDPDASSGYVISSSNFQVDANGNMTASNARLLGYISASEGYIGSWQIIGNNLVGDNITMDGIGSKIYMNNSQSVTTGYYIDFTPNIDEGKSYYVRFGPNFAISESGQLIASGAVIEGEIQADTGSIGGWRISTNRLRNDVLDDWYNVGLKSSTTPNDITFYAGAETKNSTGSAPFRVTNAGDMYATNAFISGTIHAQEGTLGDLNVSGSITVGNGGEITTTDGSYTLNDTGFTLKSGSINLNNKFIATTEGQFTASAALISGSDVDINVENFYVSGTNVELITPNFYVGNNAAYISASDNNLTISSSEFRLDENGVYISGSITASAGEIGGWKILSDRLQSSNNNMMLSGSGVISSSNFYVTETGDVTGSQVLFTGGTIGGWSLSDTYLVDLNNKIKLEPNASDYVISSSNFQVTPDGHITGSQVLFTGGEIAGWGITQNYLSSSGLLINSSGTIQTTDFIASGLPGAKGWRIDNTGKAEFENATIRGTLSTTVFEKDTISAIGGQVIISNATTVSGSNTILYPTDNVFPVDNIGGFVIGEYIVMKAIGNDGFYREISQITALDADNNTITLDRGVNVPEFYNELYQWLFTNDPSYEGTIPEITEGQVLVSLGTSGSGYIHINADPTDNYTPYLDVWERTGSAVNDVELLARLGDLSGLSPTYTFDQTNTYGLYTKNGYFEGSIYARTGSFTGIVHAGNIKLGQNVSPLHNGILLNDDNYWFDSNEFRIGNSDEYLHWSGSELFIKSTHLIITASDIDLSSDQFHLSSSGLDISSDSRSIQLGTAAGGMTTDNYDGIILSGSGDIAIGSSTGAHLSYIDNILEISSSDFYIGNDENYISSSNEGLYIQTSNALISGSNIDIVTPNFFIGNLDTAYISSSNNNLSISASGFYLDTGGNVTLSGSIIAKDGLIGGWYINKSELYSGNFKLSGSGVISSSNFYVDNDGNITASNAVLSGSLYAESGNIAGWNINNTSFGYGNIELNSINEYISLGNPNNSMDKNTLSGEGVFASGSGQIRIGNSDEYIIWDGNDLFIKSDNLIITASDIDITTDNFNLSSSTIVVASDEGGKIKLGNNADEQTLETYNGIYASGSGEIAVGNSFGEHISFINDSIEISASNFSVDSTGNVSASNAWFDGTISASAGNIGNWNIINNAIENGNLKLTSDGEISSSNFYVDNDGNLTANNAILSGSIDVGYGKIGGWKINSDSLYSTDLKLFGNGIISSSNFYVSTNGTITASAGNIAGFNIESNRLSTSEFYIGSPDAESPSVYFISSSNFLVKPNGVITASALYLTGNSLISGSNVIFEGKITGSAEIETEGYLNVSSSAITWGNEKTNYYTKSETNDTSSVIAGQYTSSLSQSLKNDIALGVEAKNIFDSETILSSSTQIATDITGSFNSISSSLSNRIYNNEDTLLVSKSIWDKGFEASSSWFTTSSSLATRVYTQFIAGEYTSSLSQSLKNDIALGVEASQSWFNTSSSLATKTYAALTSSFEAEKYFTDNSGSLKDFATAEANAKVTELVTNSSSLWDKGLETSQSWFNTSSSIATKIYTQFIAGQYTSSLSQSLKNDIALGVEAKNIFDTETILSSSTQIASDITGSFTKASSSLSNRIYNNEDTLLVSKSIWDKGLEASSSWFSTSSSIATKTFATSEANTKVTELVTNSSSLWDSGSTVYEAINTGKDLAGNSLYTTDNKPIWYLSGSGYTQTAVRPGENVVITPGKNIEMVYSGQAEGVDRILEIRTKDNITASISSTGSLYPSSNNEYSLGRDGLIWSEIWVDDGYFSGDISVDGTVDGIDLQGFSSSISSRVFTNESNINNLQSDSASFSTRITTNENEINSIGNYTASLASNLQNLVFSEIIQLQNINSTTINSTQWGYLGNLNQALTTTSDVNFNNIDIAGLIDGIDLQEYSASISSRITSNETDIDNLQIDSSSFSSRITSNETDIVSIGNYTSSLANNLHELDSIEITQLKNINSTTINSTQWGYLGELDQSLTVGSSVLFANITASNNVSSSGYVSASHFSGDGYGLTNLNPEAFDLEDLTSGDGIADFTYDGSTVATVAVASTIAGDKLSWDSGVINHNVNGANNISLTDGNIINSLEFDSDGHVINSGSYDLDNRYYTETEIDTNFVNVSGDTMTGNLYVNGADITSSGLKVLNNIIVGGTVDSVNILETSQSISTRLTSNELDIDNLQTDSASFSNRITSNENEIDALQIDSASFSTRITSNETDIDNLQLDSGSFSSRITENEINIIAIGNYTSSLATNLHELTSTEVSQLKNIDSTTISTTQWNYLGNLDQALTKASSVEFANITVSNNVSSSGYISASHFSGDGYGLTNLNPDSIDLENLNNGDGISSFTYDGRVAATVAIAPTIAGDKLSWDSGVINHDVNGANSINLSNGNIIQSLTFDSDGHVTDSSSYDLDNRYYTETEIDTNFVNVSGDTMTGDLYVNSNISSSAEIYAPNIGTGIDNSVVVLDGNNLKTDEINPVVWDTSATFISSSNGIDNRLAIYTSPNGIEGDSNLTWNGSVLSITGKLEATQKSFVIPIPNSNNKKLEYGVIEGPEHTVFYRGKLENNYIIELPKEWVWLISEETITVQLTSIGKHQELYIDKIENNKIYIGITGLFKNRNKINCYYYVQAERKDIDKLVTLRNK